MKDFSSELSLIEDLLEKVRGQVEEMKMGMGSDEPQPEEGAEVEEDVDEEMPAEAPEEMDDESKGLKSFMEGNDKPKSAPKMGLMIGISAGKKPPFGGPKGMPFKKK